MDIKKSFQQVLVLCLLAILPALAAALWHPKRPNWDPNALREGEVYLTTVLDWGKNVLWVDTRSFEDYQKDHIQGAQQLNEANWKNELLLPIMEAWQSGHSIVIYGDERRCLESRLIFKRLHDIGLPPVYILKGGWKTWLAFKKQGK